MCGDLKTKSQLQKNDGTPCIFALGHGVCEATESRAKRRRETQEEAFMTLPKSWAFCTKCLNMDGGRHVGLAFCDLFGIPRCHMVPLDKETNKEEFLRVSDMFTAGYSKDIKVREVLRVQHPGQYHAYTREKRKMQSLIEDAGHSLYERDDLFHTSNAALDDVLTDGLDARFASSGLFGRGIYATDDAQKASSYWNGAEVRTVLQVSMLLGRPKVFPPGKYDASMLREPQGYNSCIGNMSGQTEFVVYNNSQVLINYVIRYVHHNPPPRVVRQARPAPLMKPSGIVAPPLVVSPQMSVVSPSMMYSQANCMKAVLAPTSASTSTSVPTSVPAPGSVPVSVSGSTVPLSTSLNTFNQTFVPRGVPVPLQVQYLQLLQHSATPTASTAKRKTNKSSESEGRHASPAAAGSSSMPSLVY